MTHVDGGGVPAGTQLNGIYEIDKRIAMGGMGEVYIGHVIQTGDKVAIKMILPEHANNQMILDLFRKEASTLHNLYHEAIVRYFVFSVDPVLNRPYLAMEYAEGPALGERVRTYPLSEAEMSVLLPRVAGGLHAAHKAGIVHRDLSPDNIILVGGDVNRAKIIDFGIAKSSSSEGTLIGSGFAGKLKYVSPEQLGLGNGEVTVQADIYSLALVLAEAASGQPLDMGGSQVEVIEKRRGIPDLSTVPAYIQPLINWMLQPDPADRPASMEIVAGWTPSTPTPAPGTSAPAGDATQIAPAGFTAPPTAPTSSRSTPAHRAGADADQQQTKRRRRGPLPVLSLLLSGTVVAGIAAAMVIMSNPDLRLRDGSTIGGAITGDGESTAGGDGDGNGGAKGSGTKTAGHGADGGTDRDGTAVAGKGAGGGTAGTVGDGTSDGTDRDMKVVTADGRATEPPKIGSPGTLLTPPAGGGETSGDSGLRVGGGGSSDVNTGSGPGTLAAGGDTADGLVVPKAADAPRLPGGDTAMLSSPGAAGGETAGISAGGEAKLPDTASTSTPALTDGGGTTGPSLSKAPVDAEGGGDPADRLSEPRIARDGPGQLTVAGDTDLTGAPETGGLTVDDTPVAATPGSLDTATTVDADSTGGLIPVTDGGAARPLGGADAPALSDPGAGDSGSVAGVGGGETTTPGLTDPKVSDLTGGGSISDPSLSKAPLSANEKDPVATLAEPKVTTLSPGGLSAPTSSEGSALATDGNSNDIALPRTGDSGPSAPGTPAGGTTELAAVAAPKNQPPTIRNRVPDSLSAGQGQPLDMRLGEFFDEDGAVNLSLKVQGDVPNGLTFEMVTGGIVRMFGTPTEYGRYTIKVAAIDSAGLISESITVALRVERPRENREVRDYVLAYRGGDCFLTRPMRLAPREALIEVFLSEAEIPAVYKFDEDFKTENGFEANIRARLISVDQCELVYVLGKVGPEALDNSLVIQLVEDQLRAGDTLSGKIQGGRGARLFLFDNKAGVADLSDFISELSGEIGFRVPISGGRGPQILIAARPREGSGLSATASLNQLLAAAQQGRASLALGFFILK